MRIAIMLLLIVVLIALGVYFAEQEVPQESLDVPATTEGEMQPAPEASADIDPAAEMQAQREAETERGRHFEVAVPETDEAARTLLAEQAQIVKQALAEKDFDRIHEASYAIEAGFSRLENSAIDAGDDALLNRLAEAQERLFTIHHASEEYDEALVNRETPLLLAEIRGLL